MDSCLVRRTSESGNCSFDPRATLGQERKESALYKQLPVLLRFGPNYAGQVSEGGLVRCLGRSRGLHEETRGEVKCLFIRDRENGADTVQLQSD